MLKTLNNFVNIIILIFLASLIYSYCNVSTCKNTTGTPGGTTKNSILGPDLSVSSIHIKKRLTEYGNIDFCCKAVIRNNTDKFIDIEWIWIELLDTDGVLIKDSVAGISSFLAHKDKIVNLSISVKPHIAENVKSINVRI